MTTMFTWNDEVSIKPSAPTEYRPNEEGWIVGIWQIETAEHSTRYDQPIGATIYLVEFVDGSSMLVPTRYIEAMKT